MLLLVILLYLTYFWSEIECIFSCEIDCVHGVFDADAGAIPTIAYFVFCHLTHRGVGHIPALHLISVSVTDVSSCCSVSLKSSSL